ncbi:MAG: hypothetical protein E6R03_00190 [Hyphomicrobiaceae bacterium]|nr:MAG: hypothetical protein E6R03_00190 [Hyphomicrobiaceae bacterium]
MSTTLLTATNKTLKTALAYLRSWQVEAKQSFSLGKAVALVTATAVNQQQTISIGSGTPTSGAFELTAEGTVLSIAFDDTAAEVQTKLEAVFGVGNVVCSSGPLPGTSVVVTFQGEFAGLYVTPMVVGTSSLSAGTPACAITRTNVPYYRLVAWNPATITDPTAALSVSATGSGGSFTATVHIITYTWSNAQGETRAARPTVLALTSGQQIRVAAINAAGTPDDATYLNVYVDGILAKKIAVSTPGTGGNVAQTDIADYDTANAFVAPPDTNTAYTATNGAHKLLGFLNKAVSTDWKGGVFHSTAATGTIQMGGIQDADVVVGGIVNQANLVGISGYETIVLSQLNAKILSGTIAGGDAEIAFGPYGGDL